MKVKEISGKIRFRGRSVRARNCLCSAIEGKDARKRDGERALNSVGDSAGKFGFDSKSTELSCGAPIPRGENKGL